MAISKGTIIGLLVLGVVLLLIFILAVVSIGTYNSLVSKEVEVDKSWSEVDNQLMRRSDLIPNYVETVKGYAAHENELFTNIANARAKLAGAANVPDKISAANELSGFLSRLLVIVENYPQLKANENFMKLQDELAGTENRISVARTRYNQAVQAFNTSVRSFPSNLIAGIFNFQKKEFFEAPESAKTVPQVKF